MALDLERLKLLTSNLKNANPKTISSISKQLFGYLSSAVKSNPVFDRYESEYIRLEEWPSEYRGDFYNWEMPSDLEEAKYVAYSVYKKLGHRINGGRPYLTNLFRDKNIQDSIDKLNNTFLEYLEDAIKDIVKADKEVTGQEMANINSNKVFIIHGHDDNLKDKVNLFLRKAGLEVVILHEQPDLGRTIIEKLIDETKDAGYAVALLTPDDITNDGFVRARQNVILEIGYFLGMLGQSKVRLLLNNKDLDIPSDLHGILYTLVDDSEKWKGKLLKEVSAVGIKVDYSSAL